MNKLHGGFSKQIELPKDDCLFIDDEGREISRARLFDSLKHCFNPLWTSHIEGQRIFYVSKGVAYRAYQVQLVGYLSIAGAGNGAGRAFTRRTCDRACDFESTGLNRQLRWSDSFADGGRSNQASGICAPAVPDLSGI